MYKVFFDNTKPFIPFQSPCLSAFQPTKALCSIVYSSLCAPYKFIYSRLTISFSRQQHSSRELGMMRGIWEMLHFETKSKIFSISQSVCSFQITQIRSRSIKLHSRFCGICFQYSTRNRINHFDSKH